eukprot:492713-Prymnesium_polylepis.2
MAKTRKTHPICGASWRRPKLKPDECFVWPSIHVAIEITRCEVNTFFEKVIHLSRIPRSVVTGVTTDV